MRKRAKDFQDRGMDRTDPEDDRQYITALHRGLRVLRAFELTDKNGLGNLDLAKRTGFPNSTVSRITFTLARDGYLIYDHDSGRYRMGVAVLGLGYACLGGIQIREIARVHMHTLAERCGTGVLVALGDRDDRSMTYIACARSSGMVSLQLDVGSRISLARSAIGRAYIAGAKPEERSAIIDSLREHYEPQIWSEIEAGIQDAIEQIGTRGFYVNCGEWQPDVHGVAAPFTTRSGDGQHVVFNCGGPSFFLPKARLENEIGPALLEMIAAIRRDCGDEV